MLMPSPRRGEPQPASAPKAVGRAEDVAVVELPLKDSELQGDGGAWEPAARDPKAQLRAGAPAFVPFVSPPEGQRGGSAGDPREAAKVGDLSGILFYRSSTTVIQVASTSETPSQYLANASQQFVKGH